jgi:hypothetical protein
MVGRRVAGVARRLIGLALCTKLGARGVSASAVIESAGRHLGFRGTVHWAYGFRRRGAAETTRSRNVKDTRPNNEMKLTKGTATDVEHASRHFVPRRTIFTKVPFAAYLGVIRSWSTWTQV